MHCKISTALTHANFCTRPRDEVNGHNQPNLRKTLAGGPAATHGGSHKLQLTAHGLDSL